MTTIEKDISSSDVLKELAVDAGMDVAEVDEWFDSHSASDVVDEEARRNKEMANSGFLASLFKGRIGLTRVYRGVLKSKRRRIGRRNGIGERLQGSIYYTVHVFSLPSWL